MLETLAVLFSITYVILAARENIWCWLAAAISTSLYIFICYNAKLYAETGLQFFYFLMATIGYLSWKGLKIKNENTVIKKSNIIELKIKHHFFIILIGILISFILGYILSAYTDAKMPLLDSVTTVFSVFATIMVIKKVLENWLYFIVIDIASIYLYYSRGLDQTAILFIVYTLIAIVGYLNWIKLIKTNE
tara:strand:- start:1080 stop:1652 length:573 start_codon:yes stop_codon:yes gene_type:complete